MPPAAVCDACGARSTHGGRVRSFNELGFGPENEAKAIHLCDDCLERREARQWRLEDETGQRVYEALHERSQASKERYSYLMADSERIHLMRLRPEWVDHRAADT